MIESLIDRALELAAHAATLGEVPVGALVVSSQNEILGEGYNRRESAQDPLGHAEIMAIQNAAQAKKAWRLEDCTLIVTLEPCLMCLSAAQQARIKELVYCTPDPKGGSLSLGYKPHQDLRTNHRFRCTLKDDERASTILKRFFQDLRTARS